MDKVFVSSFTPSSTSRFGDLESFTVINQLANDH